MLGNASELFDNWWFKVRESELMKRLSYCAINNEFIHENNYFMRSSKKDLSLISNEIISKYNCILYTSFDFLTF